MRDFTQESEAEVKHRGKEFEGSHEVADAVTHSALGAAGQQPQEYQLKLHGKKYQDSVQSHEEDGTRIAAGTQEQL